MTEDEMTEEVYSWLLNESEDIIKDFANQSETTIKTSYSHLGRMIRNKFGLWEREWSPELMEVNGVEIDVSSNHPDAISFRIVEAVWMKAREEYGTT